MEKFLISPVMTFDIPKYATQKEDYIRILNLASEEFDKVPYQAHEDNGSIQRFERRVLNILNN